MTNQKKTLVVPMILIGSMFAVLGFALGINAFFVPFVKEAFHISITMSYLVMTATFLSFVVFGLPSGAIIKKFGYKGGMIIAFLIMALGFYLIAPAAKTCQFSIVINGFIYQRHGANFTDRGCKYLCHHFGATGKRSQTYSHYGNLQ